MFILLLSNKTQDAKTVFISCFDLCNMTYSKTYKFKFKEQTKELIITNILKKKRFVETKYLGNRILYKWVTVAACGAESDGWKIGMETH